MNRIGIDLGGTKIEAAVLGRDGDMLWSERVATPTGDYAGTLQAIAELVRRAKIISGTLRAWALPRQEVKIRKRNCIATPTARASTACHCGKICGA